MMLSIFLLDISLSFFQMSTTGPVLADHLARFEVAFADLPWKQIVTRCINAGVGLPMGYVDADGVHTNPPPDARCSGNAIILLVDEALVVTKDAVAACMEAVPAAA